MIAVSITLLVPFDGDLKMVNMSITVIIKTTMTALPCWCHSWTPERQRPFSLKSSSLCQPGEKPPYNHDNHHDYDHHDDHDHQRDDDHDDDHDDDDDDGAAADDGNC